MNRMQSFVRLGGLTLAAALLLFNSGAVWAQTTPTAPPSAAATDKPAATHDAEETSSAPEVAPPLPPGMAGSTLNDPRVGLKP